MVTKETHILSLKMNRGRRCGEEVAQTMYTHVSKCKNYKIKKKYEH
jgi:hypothetical protein